MPEILDKHVAGMEKKGMPKDKAYAIATSNLQDQGKMRKSKNDAYKRKMDRM